MLHCVCILLSIFATINSLLVACTPRYGPHYMLNYLVAGLNVKEGNVNLFPLKLLNCVTSDLDLLRM